MPQLNSLATLAAATAAVTLVISRSRANLMEIIPFEVRTHVRTYPTCRHVSNINENLAAVGPLKCNFNNSNHVPGCSSTFTHECVYDKSTLKNIFATILMSINPRRDLNNYVSADFHKNRQLD